MTPTELKAKIDENRHLLNLKESESHPGLFVMKYKKKVFYDNLWNDFLEEARGLIVDADFNIISRPFLKIYNYSVEAQAPTFSNSDTLFCMRKVNGFMVAVTWDVEHGILISTTGSLDSDFVKLAEKHVAESGAYVYAAANPDSTIMFECCDPSDPHIVDEKPGLYLLGKRIKQSGLFDLGWISRQDISELHKNSRGVYVPEYKYRAIDQIQAEMPFVKHEGFVFYSMDGRAAKIKSVHYLTKKALMRGNFEKIMNRDAKEYLDEEFYPLIDRIKSRDADLFMGLDEMGRRAYIEKYFKEIA